MNHADNTEIEPDEVAAVLAEVLSWEAHCIEQLCGRLNQSFVQAVDLLSGCRGKVILSGMGKMGCIAQKAAATFCSLGLPAVFLHPGDAFHGDLGLATSGDLWIGLSNSGATEEVVALVSHLNRIGCASIAITGRTDSALARQCQLVLDISVPREADLVAGAPTASTTVALALCDALAVAVARSQRLTAEKFAAFHPGGFLGRRLLLTVSELMHAGNRIPLTNPTAKLREAIVVMSQKALGCVFVIGDAGELVGILTDGDLRRSLAAHHNPLEDVVSMHMTKSPQTVNPNVLAVTAIRTMEQFEITVLPVVDERNVPVGAIHLHDLVQAGLG